jgi:hypothetical protein
VCAWKLKKRSKRDVLSFSKGLLTTLLYQGRKVKVVDETIEGRENTTVNDPMAGSVSQAPGNPQESSMFNYLERKTEKRIFYSYLHRFELTQEHLSAKVSRLLLSEINRHSRIISKRFDEPLSSVSRNVISAAAWGTIYCLLGATRMIELRPDYREISDKVELELMLSFTEMDSDDSIYRDIFSILAEYGLCHSEVTALIEACMVSPMEGQAIHQRLSVAR